MTNFAKIWVSNIEWDRLIHESHLNDAVSIVSDEILKAAGNNIPNKFIVVRSEDPPWMNSVVRRKIRKRKRLHRRAKNKDTQEVWENFRRAPNDCVNKMKMAKTEYFEKQRDSLDSSDIPIKKWWKTLRNLSGLPCNYSNYPLLIITE